MNNNYFFDCAIITVLQEEMNLFLESFKNKIQLFEIKQNYAKFYFCDKNNYVRKGIIYNVGNKMGNSEACKLMYEFTRKYRVDIYINIGVACGASDVNIGDVIIVNECYSLSEKNSTKSKLQQTSLKGYDSSYIEDLFNNIDKIKQSDFEKITNKRIDKIKESSSNDETSRTINELFLHNCNHILLGECATVPYVIKTKPVYNSIIKSCRKCNVIEMEAYYLAYWHYIIRKNESDKIDNNSRFLIIKSPSDNGVDNDKKALEKIGSRKLAMDNLAFVVEYIITELISFNNEGIETVSEYIKRNFGSISIDKLSNCNQSEKFNELCKYLISNQSIDDYFCFANNILNERGSTLLIYGPSGTGKSTFFSYLHNQLQYNHCCVYLDISKLINRNNPKNIDICLYFLERMLQAEKYDDVIVFIDGIGNDLDATSEQIIEIYTKLLKLISNKGNKKISYCFNDTYNDKIESEYIPRINHTSKILFSTFDAKSQNLNDFINAFFNYYKVYKDISIEYQQKAFEFIVNSKIQYVDFRLLKMFADNINLLNRVESFEEFINEYCILKAASYNEFMEISQAIYSKYNASEYQSFNLSDISVDKLELFKMIAQNTYTNSFALSNIIWNMCNSVKKELENFELVISKNVNMFLCYCICKSNGKEINKKVNNIITQIKRKSIKRSTSIQLLYVFCKRNVYNKLSLQTKNTLETIVKAKAKNILDDNNNLSYLDIMEYRTMGIIMSYLYNDETYLKKYNERMLSNICDCNHNEYFNYNMIFHFLYYSQENFLYSDIETSIIDGFDEKSVLYTFNSIESFLLNNINQVDQLYIMNYITLLYIYESYVCNNKLKGSVDIGYCNNLLSKVYNKLNEINMVSKELEEYCNQCFNSQGQIE